MENENVLETIKDSFLDVVDTTVDYIPNVVVALLLVFVGWLVANFVSKWVGKLVEYVETNKQVVGTLNKLGASAIDVDGVVEIFTKWTILLIFVSAAVDVLGFSVLSDTFDALVGFVPNILAAAVIAALSFIAANVLYDIVDVSARNAKVKAHKFLAQATRVVVLVFGLPLAAAQLGLDLTIITNNITVVVAGIMLAFGLSFGLGGKEVAGKIVNDLYKNWKK